MLAFDFPDDDYDHCRHCGQPGGFGKHAPFQGFRALCGACGALLPLRGCSRHGHESGLPTDHATGFPLHRERCKCGAIAEGLVPLGAIRETVHVDVATA